MKTVNSNPAPRMSDEAVLAKTGKNWKQWFAIIDKAGGQKMTHQEIVKLLTSKYNVGPWWCQMVTATYEQQTGRRAHHQKPSGFEISVSRTINTSAGSTTNSAIRTRSFCTTSTPSATSRILLSIRVFAIPAQTPCTTRRCSICTSFRRGWSTRFAPASILSM